MPYRQKARQSPDDTDGAGTTTNGIVNPSYPTVNGYPAIMTNGNPSKSKHKFNCSPVTLKNSIRVPDEFLENYWSTFEPRLNVGSDLEVRACLECRQDLIDYGLPLARAAGVTVAGGVNSLLVPEGEPSKVINMGPITDIHFVGDGETDFKPI
ncbi:hypothetical protein ABW21_db0209574 [Orbilia brochopaga]|nr:hypothetical protein ABW21_db0209574 [Drechslerella brochopaga]